MKSLILSQTFNWQGKLVLSRSLQALFIPAFSSVAYIPWNSEDENRLLKRNDIQPLELLQYLLVRSVKLATVITASFELQEHSHITSQYVVGDGHFLKGRVPANCPLSHYGSVGGKVYAMKHGFVCKWITLKTVKIKRNLRYQ